MEISKSNKVTREKVTREEDEMISKTKGIIESRFGKIGAELAHVKIYNM